MTFWIDRFAVWLLKARKYDVRLRVSEISGGQRGYVVLDHQTNRVKELWLAL